MDCFGEFAADLRESLPVPDVYYDLETCINGKGQARAETVPIEIAMLDPVTHEHVQCAFWPLSFPIADALRAHGANVSGSLNCVKKVFGRIPTRHDDTCRTLAEARDAVRAFPLGKRLIAHNGRSFDDPIYRSWFDADPTQRYADSLKMLRASRPKLMSHSLPNLTKAVRADVVAYMDAHGHPASQQHRALFDVVALAHVMKHYSLRSVGGTSGTSLRSVGGAAAHDMEEAEEWREVPGIGKKTADALRARFDTPEAFIAWAAEQERCEIKSVLKGLGVRRIPTVLRLLP